ILIASYAIGCNLAFIYIRGEYLPQTEALEAAIDEARQAGYLGKNVLGKGYDIDVILHRGAGAYICGEETAMLTSLEGYRGEPRLKPPFPAIKGLYGKPTVVNNVVTDSNLPHIVLNGADWFAAIGTPTGKGTSGRRTSSTNSKRARPSRATSTCCSTSATTSMAAPSVRWVTPRPGSPGA